MATATPTTVRTAISEQVAERTSWRYTATMKDEAGLAIATSDIFTLILTIYNLDTDRTIVNGCEAEDIFNAGRGTVHATSGLLTIMFEPDDSAMVATTKSAEQHVALIEVAWLGGTKSAAHEVSWTVVNMDLEALVMRRAMLWLIVGLLLGFVGTAWSAGSIRWKNEAVDAGLQFKVGTGLTTAPGASMLRLTVVCGTNSGTVKLVVRAGTSDTAVDVKDNIGSGVTGC